MMIHFLFEWSLILAHNRYLVVRNRTRSLSVVRLKNKIVIGAALRSGPAAYFRRSSEQRRAPSEVMPQHFAVWHYPRRAAALEAIAHPAESP